MKKHKQPIIGITLKLDEGVLKTGIRYDIVRTEYGEQVRAAGGQPVFLDPSIDPLVAMSICDGLVISGGDDLEPSFYGQQREHTQLVEPSQRTAWERQLIDECDRAGKHVLGICYGSQLLNVHYGGTLYQDIAIQYGNDVNHGSQYAPSIHEVVFGANFLGFRAGDIIQSNARHHQAVKELAPGFHVVATARDGVIEAIAGNGHYGVQWHAEADGTAESIYGNFIALCSDVNVTIDLKESVKDGV